MPEDQQAAQEIFRQAFPIAAVERSIKNYAKRKFDDEGIDPAYNNKKLKGKHIVTYVIPWTPEQDKHFADLVSIHKNKWTRIAELMASKFSGFGKTAKQCSEHWNNRVNPELNTNKWTKEEEALLLKNYEKFGTSWNKYKKDFPDRSQSAIKNRWDTIKNRVERQAISQSFVDTLAKPILTKKNIRARVIITDVNPWTPEQDKHLADLVSIHKYKWSQIARLMALKFPGFSKLGKQCGEHWDNLVDPMINRNEWTEEEDALLLKKYTEFGTSWKEYKKDFPDRSQNAIKNRWNVIKRRKGREAISQSSVAALAEPILTKKNIPTQSKRQYAKKAKVTKISSVSKSMAKAADSPRENRERDALNSASASVLENTAPSRKECKPATVAPRPRFLWEPEQEIGFTPLVLPIYSAEYLSSCLGSLSSRKSDSDLSDFADIAHLFDNLVGLQV